MKPTESLEILFEKHKRDSLDQIISNKYDEIESYASEILYKDDDKIEYKQFNNNGDKYKEIYSMSENARECISFCTEMFIKLLNSKIESIISNQERIEYITVIKHLLHSTVEKGILNYTKYKDIIINETAAAFLKIEEYISLFGVIVSNDLRPKQLNWQGQQNQLAQLFKKLMDNPTENKGKPFFSNTNDEVIEFISRFMTCNGKNINMADLKRLSSEDKLPKLESPKEINLKNFLN
jgi:hypothetical protein